MFGSFVPLYSTPDTCLLWTKKLNFKTGKYYLSDTPIRDRYLQFVKWKNVYLNSHKPL